MLEVERSIRADDRADYDRRLALRRPTRSVDVLLARGWGHTYRRLFTPIPSTRPAYYSLLTQLNPSDHQVISNASVAPAGLPHIADSLRRQNYRTAAFLTPLLTTDTRRDPSSLRGLGPAPDTSISSKFNVAPVGEVNGTDGDRAAAAITWLQSVPISEPVFLWLQLDAPKARAPSRESYLGAVAQTHAIAERFVEGIEKLGRYRNATIAITSPHGRTLESVAPENALCLSESTLHVPLWVKSSESAPSTSPSTDAQLSLTDVMSILIPTSGDSARFVPADRRTTLTVETYFPTLDHGKPSLRAELRDGIVDASTAQVATTSRVPIGQVFPPFRDATPATLDTGRQSIQQSECLSRAELERSRGERNRAIELVDSILAEDPTHLGAALRKAILLFDMGRPDEAVAYLKSIAPPRAEAYRLAASLAQSTSPAEATALLTRAVDLRPDRFELQHELARAILSAGDVVTGG